MIGFNMRYMNIFRTMKDAIDAGEIGEPKAVWVRHFVGPGGNWYYHDWHAVSRNATGLLLQKASHDIDMIHWLTGRYTTRAAATGALSYYGGDKPNDLRCPDCDEQDECIEFQGRKRSDGPAPPNDGNRMDQCVFREEVDVEDQSIVMMELEGGLQATYMQCHFAPDYWRNYTIIGTEGRVENLDDQSRVILRIRRRSKRWHENADREIAVPPAEGSHGGADPVICRDFIDMIADGKRPLATPLAGRMSVAVGCAATWSLRNGWQPVTIPAVPEEIRDRVY